MSSKGSWSREITRIEDAKLWGTIAPHRALSIPFGIVQIGQLRAEKRQVKGLILFHGRVSIKDKNNIYIYICVHVHIYVLIVLLNVVDDNEIHNSGYFLAQVSPGRAPGVSREVRELMLSDISPVWYTLLLVAFEWIRFFDRFGVLGPAQPNVAATVAEYGHKLDDLAEDVRTVIDGFGGCPPPAPCVGDAGNVSLEGYVNASESWPAVVDP